MFLSASNDRVQKMGSKVDLDERSQLLDAQTPLPVQNKKQLPGTSNRNGTSLICSLIFCFSNTPSLLLESNTSVPKFDKDLLTDEEISKPLKDKIENRTKQTKMLPDKSKNLTQAPDSVKKPLPGTAHRNGTSLIFLLQICCSNTSSLF